MKTIRIVIDGTTAALNVPIGFVPNKVVVTNEVTRTQLCWDSEDDTNEFGIAVAAAGTRATTAAAANGVIPYVGTALISDGITLGAAATCTVNVNGNQLIVEASFYSE